VVEEEEYPQFGRRQASGEELGGGEHLFVGAAVEGELVAIVAREHSVSGAPVLFGTKENQLLSAILASEDDLLRRT
jgi:hypothetical protein